MREDEWPRFVQGTAMLSDTRIFIDDTPALPLLEMRTKVRRLASEHGVDFVMVDYLQLMRAGHRDNASRKCRRSPAAEGAGPRAERPRSRPVTAVRAVESRNDKRPMLSDLRESGSIEQDADVVLFIYRDDMYNETAT